MKSNQPMTLKIRILSTLITETSTKSTTYWRSSASAVLRCSDRSHSWKTMTFPDFRKKKWKALATALWNLSTWSFMKGGNSIKDGTSYRSTARTSTTPISTSWSSNRVPTFKSSAFNRLLYWTSSFCKGWMKARSLVGGLSASLYCTFFVSRLSAMRISWLATNRSPDPTNRPLETLRSSLSWRRSRSKRAVPRTRRKTRMRSQLPPTSTRRRSSSNTLMRATTTAIAITIIIKLIINNSNLSLIKMKKLNELYKYL